MAQEQSQNAMQYVVVKASRKGSNRTYTGSGWEKSGLIPPTLASGMNRHDLYLYDSQEVAEDYAKTLSTVNLVEFVVEEYKPNMRRFPTSILQRCQNVAFSLYEGLDRRTAGGFVLPSFQRGEVWTTEQKIRFVESLILKLPVGSYCVHEDLSTEIKWELLDGQQRWSAIFDYVDDKFAVFGLKYSELNNAELRYFKGLTFPVFIATGFAEEEKYELFTRLAYGGTPNSVDDAPTTRERLI